ncbi:AMP-binding protein [Acidocella aminolytica]|uniref:3-methylmercaptopropionyl-CoA ligase n=1 Tax=Acidocella aminolytica 101 = DSM 11237 TaxID=1120923 RepID=A0A0D6PB07_9PROT|nr:AMP-binding protein [Acidocella aminolytica]GAN78837.1 acyl-CoA synthetase [Acidocella aminolytica 101 = DSM 11237]GBQ33251.1 acyl-CoA synthetase [Acidocella aminolytica 101 = DSM 11237]SHF17456.1 fatty-acyl-CoA synthase [Acidocella aminolytica 101 = DSM 11237]
MVNVVDDSGIQARLQPDALAVYEFATNRRWNYAEWDEAIARTAGLLAGQYGIKMGARIAALGRNCAEQALLHLACARLGAIFVPLNWRLAVAEQLRLLEDCEPELLVGDSEFLLPLASAIRQVELVALRPQIERAAPLAPVQFDRSRPSLILYTSGTSGRPKGVLLSERNIAQTAVNFGMLARVTHQSAMLAETPMFHIMGIITNLRPAFMRGGAVLLSEGFEPSRTLARLSDSTLKVSHYFCVPQMAQMLRNTEGFDPEKLRNLTAIFSGGAPHPAADIRAWLRDGIPIADGFGMSEAGTVSCMPIHIPIIDQKAGATGLVPPAIQTRIVGAEGQEVAPGMAGELLLKGDNIFIGYWRAPEETAKAFTEDGWFRTGDIARQDEDGFLFLVDRKKDMFISGGENVYPVEIEAVLAALPGIREAAVVGVPDARWGEVGHLAVVVAENGPDENLILEFLNARLARYKIPKYISFVEVLPRTGTGKIQKPQLRIQLSQKA